MFFWCFFDAFGAFVWFGGRLIMFVGDPFGNAWCSLFRLGTFVISVSSKIPRRLLSGD